MRKLIRLKIVVLLFWNSLTIQAQEILKKDTQNFETETLEKNEKINFKDSFEAHKTKFLPEFRIKNFTLPENKYPVSVNGEITLESGYSDLPDSLYGYPDFYSFYCISNEVNLFSIPLRILITSPYPSNNIFNAPPEISFSFNSNSIKNNFLNVFNQNFERVSRYQNSYNMLKNIAGKRIHRRQLELYDELLNKVDPSVPDAIMENEEYFFLYKYIKNYDPGSTKEVVLETVKDSASSLEFMNLQKFINSDNKKYQNKIVDSLKLVDPGKATLFENFRYFQELESFKKTLEKEKKEKSGFAGKINKLASQTNPSDYLPKPRSPGTTSLETALLSIEELNFGRVYLSYSPLFIDLLELKGVDFTITPGNFIIRASKGKFSNNPFLNYKNSIKGKNISYTDKLSSAQIGYQLGKSSIYLNFAHFENMSSLDSLPLQKPSTIGGVLLDLVLNPNLSITGEINTILENGVSENEFVQPESSSFNDPFAKRLALNYSLYLTNTVISGEFREVGQLYNTPGVNYFDNGISFYRAKITQAFLKNRVVLSASLDRKILEQKVEEQSEMNYFGFEAHIAGFSKLPFVYLAYFPFTFQHLFEGSGLNIDTTIVLNSRSNTFVANVGYISKINKIDVFANLNFVRHSTPLTKENGQDSVIIFNDINLQSYLKWKKFKLENILSLGFKTQWEKPEKKAFTIIGTFIPSKKLNFSFGQTVGEWKKSNYIKSFSEAKFNLNKNIYISVFYEIQNFHSEYIYFRNFTNSKKFFHNTVCSLRFKF